MLNIAIFISGRIIGYKEGLLPVINKLKQNYNIILFFSINTFSLGDNPNLELITNDLKNTFNIGEIYFEEYKFPFDYVETKIKNNSNSFEYNSLSSFYNNKKNMELIENYEKNNNISFDIICKSRADNIFHTNVNFIVDDKDEIIIRNKHIMDIRHWGHIYNNTPIMVSTDFAYGNKKSMQHYCSTYDWILKNNVLLNGHYSHAAEIYLTDSILQYVFYNVPGGGQIPLLTIEQIIDKYINNPKMVKIICLHDIKYDLLPQHIRLNNNFIVDTSNIHKYTKL
jgi:hypothetical protein